MCYTINWFFVEIYKNMENNMDKFRSALKNITFDKTLIFISVLYVTLPIVLFAFGWLKLPLAILILSVFIFFVYKLQNNIINGTEINLFNKENKRYWGWVILICFIWVYMSGVGSMVYQNTDHFVRNPIYRDLASLSWPLTYDLSQESEIVQYLCGSGTVAFSYYLSWWLPPAGLSKLLGLGDSARFFVLYLWCVLGIFLVIYLINRKLGKCTWLVPVILIIFSGLDVIPWFIKNEQITLPFISGLEWWAHYFQYSSNTSLLFWVFNQAVPIWVIMALLLQVKDNKYVGALCSLVFAYSPWATYGIVPIAIAGSFRKGEKPLKVFNIVNIFIPIIMLVVFGLFYSMSSSSGSHLKFIFSVYPGERRRLLFCYLLFIFFEFGVYFIAMGEKAYKYYLVTLIELLLFPLFLFQDGNLTMRGTIPALFLNMFFVIKYLDTVWRDDQFKIRKKVLIWCLAIGTIAPLVEVNRTVQKTMLYDDLLQEQIVSYADIQTTDEYYITTSNYQFFVNDYKNTNFFKYIGK